MAKVLVLFAHPALEKSRVHNMMISQIRHLQGVTFHDLYETYPDLDIDIKKEQQLLLLHDIIVFQHPFYWYSCPAVIKQWMDLVLEHGWAYGSHGLALTGKKVLNAISCGGSREAYSNDGRNRFTIRQFLAPFDQTATLCKMQYLPPFAVHGTHRLDANAIENFALQYRLTLTTLVRNEITDEEFRKVDYINDIIPLTETAQS